MSLLLRQELQPVLDAHNLQFLHVEINNAKSLAIVGECGKPLTAINGIRFSSSNTITKAEINFAKELFAKFMLKHGEKLVKIVEQKQSIPNGSKLSDYEIGQLPTFLQDKSTMGELQRFPIYLAFSIQTQVKNAHYSINLAADGSTRISFPSSILLTSDEIANVLADHQSKLASLAEIHTTVSKYVNTMTAFTSLNQELNSCDI